ncbi:alpha-mannosidase [Fimbriimonas ginsengisoli]|uniref:Glycosyl hydrolase 38 domain protein n=1 Tax=Fimbriimonas ginsengisoli Gsoil 348 TaxID=661478 RepID=A0A068NVC3_FIMGI|nr:alpha-mannosidase [Fimbriimonas ginsengisoli]AIE87473.1 glycosyl hydrolase 38 domain protein [Fimbriimonas ginsengisoli Gsoil 348]
MTVSLLALAAISAHFPVRAQADTCLAFVSSNLAHGRENFFTYYKFSDQRIAIKEGDVLVYSVFLDPKNPVAKGGLDVDFADDKDSLRDIHLKDTQGLDCHGDTVLTPAIGKWYVRRIPLVGQAGRTTVAWNANFEGDEFGPYVQWLDDIYVEHADGTRTPVYTNGLPPTRQLVNSNGYSKLPIFISVDRSKVVEGANTAALVAQVEAAGKRIASLENARRDIEFARGFLKGNPDPALEGHIREAAALLDAVERKENASPEEIQAALHAANHALSHTHPVMEKYTGHLVGHAHIDLQWLWEWQEGLVVTHDTFNQAAKFMDEFPGFTFSQSSSWLYKAVEEQYPALFKTIQQKVKKGQWELVGGRVCEGDTNMISPESHARQFLYGQRYFREKFGKTARVAWEPDTFGHNAQMPQIAKLGGCDAYYFCRGGKEKPLFWWTALDGTKILTFDEPATGSWYNSDLSYKQFQEMLDFRDKTGSKDMLWVYGVGNHGGGPTREMIQEALGWMKDPTKPKVRFSTATEFFDKLRTYDLKKIPTIQDELNPVFDGCYTTHSEIKQLNRQAEAMTTAAEAIATVASLRGFAYPKASFRRNWEEICFNHHHDTLPGSGIHAPYEKTKVQLQRVVFDDRDIIQRAMESMAVQVTAPKGISQMVFNPTGWTRSGWVETYLVKSGWDADSGVTPENAVAVAPDGAKFPVQLIDGPSRKIRFWAGNVPAFGYKVFNFQIGTVPKPKVRMTGEGSFETDAYQVTFDVKRGLITSLFDKRLKREMAGSSLGRLENHFEGPGGMSAWVIGAISKVEPLECVDHAVTGTPEHVEVRFDYVLKAHNSLSRDTKVTQRFVLDTRKPTIETDVDCDWNAIGTGDEPSPMLRVAFDTATTATSARYEIPFGSIDRKSDGREFPALQWADQSGIAVLNDSKHGYSSDGKTLRLTLIRASHDPDPVPNPGHHHWRYSIVPHGSEMNYAQLTEIATEFNIPLFNASVPYDARGDQPLEYRTITMGTDPVVPTALKRSEDGNDLILRFFQASGQPSARYSARIFPFFKRASWVNFVEDPLSIAGQSDVGTGSAGPDGGRLIYDLRPFEIRTVKIQLQPKGYSPKPPME